MKEADTQGEKQLIVCPSILIWNLEDTSCWPSVESDVKNGREWLFCLFLAYRKERGLDSLVTNTLCLDLGLLGSILVPEGYNCPHAFQLAPPLPSYSSKGIADSGLFLPC